jgi:hypothetical protein
MSAAGPRGSAVRNVVGWVCLMLALVILPASGIGLVRALDAGGYGTSSITVALYWLSGGGAFLAFGIALLIWEWSVRYRIPH